MSRHQDLNGFMTGARNLAHTLLLATLALSYKIPCYLLQAYTSIIIQKMLLLNDTIRILQTKANVTNWSASQDISSNSTDVLSNEEPM